MKKFMIFVTIVTMCVMSMSGQSQDSVNVVVESTQSSAVTVGGSIGYSTKNVSLGTGLVFSESPAVILNATIDWSKGEFGLSAIYGGYCGIQRIVDGDQFHLVDILGSYNVNSELTVFVGPEFTYTDKSDKDELGMGLIGMVTFNKSRSSSTFIYYSDPKFKSIYLIGSSSYKVNKVISVDGLIGYTNTGDWPVYGLIGFKCSFGSISIGAHNIFYPGGSGPSFDIVVPFSVRWCNLIAKTILSFRECRRGSLLFL